MQNSSKTWGPIPNPPKGHTWEGLMEKALYEAQQASIKGEIPVGALVVTKDGEIIGRAHNESLRAKDPSAHAEILALRRAGEYIKNYRLLDCYLVVTLEPCMMCTGAIREARLLGVIFGAYDDRAGFICSAHEGLDAQSLGVHTWHLGGILQDKCLSILQEFFQERR